MYICMYIRILLKTFILVTFNGFIVFDHNMHVEPFESANYRWRTDI